MKKLLFALLVLSGFHSSAQTIAPSILNASGGATIINSNSYEWSIAEMVDVATYNTGGNFVTTGLLQPLEEKLSIHLIPNSNNSVSIYPNPFTSIINLNIKSDDIQDIQIIVKNMLGQLVYQQAYTLMSNNDVVQISLHQLSVGPYVIEVNNLNHNLLLTEKIIKND
jgi:hypothetical protein